MGTAFVLAAAVTGAVVRADDPLQRSPQKDAVSSVSVLSETDLLSRGPQRTLSLTEALTGLPGLRIVSQGGFGMYGAALVRGAAARNVLLAIDGIVLNRGAQAALDLSQFPLEGVGQLVVYRGLPPLELGGEAMGGAIQIFTKDDGEKGVRLTLGTGSFGLRTLSATYVGASGGLRAVAALGYQGASGDFPYYFTNGTRNVAEHGVERRKNNDYDQGIASILARYRRGRIETTAYVQGLLRNQGVAGIGLPGDLIGRPRIFTGRALSSLTLRYTGSAVSLRAEAFGQLHANAFSNQPASPTTQLGGVLGAKAYVATGFSRRAVRLDAHAVLDLDHERQRAQNLAQPVDLPADPGGDPSPPSLTGSLSGLRQRTKIGLGAEVDLYLFSSRLVLLRAGLHGLYTASAASAGTTEGATASTWFPSPRLGVRISPTSFLALRASGSYMQRLPTFLELYGDGGGVYRAAFQKDLRPEVAWVAEAGADFAGRLGPLLIKLTGSGFFRDTRDLIEFWRNGSLLQARNLTAARMAGAEVEAAASYREFAQVQFAYTYLHTKILEDEKTPWGGNHLPARPPHSVFLRLQGGWHGVEAFYELDYASLRYLDLANLWAQPDRVLHGVGVTLGPFTKYDVRVSAAIVNLLDLKVVEVPQKIGGTTPQPLSDYFDFPLPGRALHLSLTIRRGP